MYIYFIFQYSFILCSRSCPSIEHWIKKKIKAAVFVQNINYDEWFLKSTITVVPQFTPKLQIDRFGLGFVIITTLKLLYSRIILSNLIYEVLIKKKSMHLYCRMYQGSCVTTYSFYRHENQSRNSWEIIFESLRNIEIQRK